MIRRFSSDSERLRSRSVDRGNRRNATDHFRRLGAALRGEEAGSEQGKDGSIVSNVLHDGEALPVKDVNSARLRLPRPRAPFYAFENIMHRGIVAGVLLFRAR